GIYSSSGLSGKGGKTGYDAVDFAAVTGPDTKTPFRLPLLYNNHHIMKKPGERSRGPTNGRGN
ncbi:hypothetical protein, partial [uncultured Cloacibacillus sp.]|uniref:hypothetical protein n=1 Tax=uncultured Cloacibacillus sp. TaxID=889794 RepID=UPI00258E5D11